MTETQAMLEFQAKEEALRMAIRSLPNGDSKAVTERANDYYNFLSNGAGQK